MLSLVFVMILSLPISVYAKEVSIDLPEGILSILRQIASWLGLDALLGDFGIVNSPEPPVNDSIDDSVVVTPYIMRVYN